MEIHRLRRSLSGPATVHRVNVALDDRRRVRAVRLATLADTPDAREGLAASKTPLGLDPRIQVACGGRERAARGHPVA